MLSLLCAFAIVLDEPDGSPGEEITKDTAIEVQAPAEEKKKSQPGMFDKFKAVSIVISTQDAQ